MSELDLMTRSIEDHRNMRLRYKGKTPVKKGEKVMLIAGDERWAEAKVVDTLAKQFTCRPLYTKHIHFYFYEDENVTWEKINA